MKNKKNIALYPHQERVVIELKELSRKRDDLLAFFDTPTFKEMENQDQDLLTIQLETMDSYIRVLEVRIGRFYELNSKENLPKALYNQHEIKEGFRKWIEDWRKNGENYEHPTDEINAAEIYSNYFLEFLKK
ncbi:crAss001_48 related protein [Empedobacter sp.]|uniref:crAss001_48 related protein n=1 Tax=Empedobacter sp. TaxID=1927715 RepID=UPI0028AB8E81|nr:hypothetical protein [Empedobacter sp.]